MVDDNRDEVDSLADMLRLLGHEVRTSHDGLEAVSEAERFRPEVILMDAGIPRLNGLDAIRRIRAKHWVRDAFIVALTGWGPRGRPGELPRGRVRRARGKTCEFA